VVVDPEQRQSYEIIYDPSISGERRDDTSKQDFPEFSLRLVIARRAYQELREGSVINYGFGIPDQVASIVAAEERQDSFYCSVVTFLDSQRIPAA